MNQGTRIVALICAAIFAAAGCGKGDKGDAGPAGTGATGSAGPAGVPGVSTGSISGVLTYKPGSTELPASNVNVATIPATVTAVTDAAGGYELANVPIGVYSLKFSGNAFSTMQVDGVSVQATKNALVSRLLNATNPIVLVAPVAAAPAGFGSQVTLGVTVSGGTAPYTYKWEPAAANPTAVTLSAKNVAAPTFTTGTLASILAVDSAKTFRLGKVTDWSTGSLAYIASPQIGFVPVSAKQLATITYNFTVTVTDSVGFVKSATVAIPPATLAQGSTLGGVGQIVIANIPNNAAAATLAGPATSTAKLQEASGPNPWFIPDAIGNYTISAGPNTVVMQANPYRSASPDCGGCHLDSAVAANVAAKFKGWNNSAHGNHFFKYMHYEGDTLVWNKDANGVNVPAPTANPTVFWNNPGPMTTYEFGMKGAEGTHYSQSCTGCHTTGYNMLARNSGMIDRMASASYAFPALSSIFTSLTGATSQQVVNSNGVVTTANLDQVTAAPVLTAWNAIPDTVKAFAGMQCESCHGPIGLHATHPIDARLPDGTMTKPVGEFSVAACAVCHDNPGNHDRVNLWRQSKHANLEVAIGEAATHTNGDPDASCGRCHAAQGFVQYVKQLTGQLKNSSGQPIPAYWGPIGDPSLSTFGTAGPAFLKGLGLTADKVQAVTCAACHDAHTTGIRVEGETPMLPSGFKVAGVGTGAVCFVCHNSRNGEHNDARNGVYFTSDLPGAKAATSIGAPHEACQGDVVAGKNAFFVSGFNPSAHLAVKDSCVGCHMGNFPAGLTGTNTNHTWKIDSTSCKSCHGGAKDPVDGEALQAAFDEAKDELESVLNTTAQGFVPGLFYKGSAQTVQLPNDSKVTFVFGRSPGFVITSVTGFNDPNNASGTINTLGTSSSAAGLGNFYTDSGATTKAFDLLKGTFAKTNWNYQLVAQDGSRGVHNPTFAFAVLSKTEEALLGSAAK
jgi:cytochrome c554/c'-like protein